MIRARILLASPLLALILALTNIVVTQPAAAEICLPNGIYNTHDSLYRLTSCGINTSHLAGSTNDPAGTAKISADGQTAVFSSGSPYAGLQTIHLTTGAITQVTAPVNAADVSPAWSPDGTRLAFFRGDYTNPLNKRLYVVGRDGHNLVHLTNAGPFGCLSSTHILWSPDNRIIYTTNDDCATYGLSSINPDNTNVQPVLSPSSDLPIPQEYGPDGQALLFLRAGSHTAWLLKPDGTTMRVTSDTVQISHAALGPDWTLYTSSSSYNGQGELITGIYASSISNPSSRTLLKRIDYLTSFDLHDAGSGTPLPDPSPTPTDPPTTPSPAAYVALGDSYSSGEGTFDYYKDSDDPATFNSCHRSPHAYGPLLTKDADLGNINFGACSGAVTDDFYVSNPVNPNEPPQLSRLNANTRVVTLTIGGNDAGFSHVITKCVDGLRKPGTPEEDKGGYGCSTNAALKRDMKVRLAALNGTPNGNVIVGRPIHALLDVYREIHRRAPNAQIYVAGYPHIFGAQPAKFQKQKNAPSGKTCEVGSVKILGLTSRYRVDYDDAQWLNQLADQLNSIVKSTVSATSLDMPITYISPNRLNQHGLCDSSKSWLHGLNFVGKTTVISPSSFHPTTIGQKQGYEQAFLASLR